jgi:hypothetical protein
MGFVMTHQLAVLVVVLMVLSPLTIAQPIQDSPPQIIMGGATFLGQHTAIPAGYSLRLSSAYAPYDRRVDQVYGKVGLTISSMLEATLNHEGVIGSPAGLLKPVPQVGVRLQVAPQREHFPAVSVFLNTMIGNQSERLEDNILRSNLSDIYQQGLTFVSYEARSTLAGLAMATTLDEFLSFSAALGVRQLTWKQGWSQYSFDTGLPTTSDGWTLPLPEQSKLQLDWSAGVMFRPLQELGFMGEVASVPLIAVDPTSLVAVARQGTVAAIGIRYFLPIPLSVDVYDRWYSEGIGAGDHHQIRVGLSTEVLFQ